MAKTVTLFWHRRDLRVTDNAGLHAALQGENPVLSLFIFDRTILNNLDDPRDARVSFIHQEIARVKRAYQAAGSDLLVCVGTPLDVWKQLTEQYNITGVWTNRDYEPYARERDQAIMDFLAAKGIPFKGRKDHVIFDKTEVVKGDGQPYVVYTPYSKRWKARLAEEPIAAFPSESMLGRLVQHVTFPEVSLEHLGFQQTSLAFPEREVSDAVLLNYAERRDIPSVQGTSRLSMHLRFGTVSVRALVQQAQRTSEKWLNELIWRDFYQSILYFFPHAATHAFRPAYDRVPWRDDPAAFDAWCAGMTGYPIVDAGMRELNTTGFMHNRVRMIVASFLTKHLLQDWRKGERYFASKLLDFELASNVGGWQWAAGSGVDAAPYFRVFNPTTQMEKFDPQKRYIKRWVPEFGTSAYPNPIVEHKMARQRAIDTYKAALSS